MRLSKALYRAAVRTLSLCSCNIHGKYVAQLTCSSVTVKVVIGIQIHRRSPVGPKRSVLNFSGSLPEAVRSLDTLSTNDVGPQMSQVGPSFEGQVAFAIKAASTRPAGRGQSFGATRVYAYVMFTELS